ncbi:MAG: hypothetical protein FJZ92_10465 [Chloroflexi bacterium]|nr:hypothetical protein [Chloroflexota bacterium]
MRWLGGTARRVFAIALLVGAAGAVVHEALGRLLHRVDLPSAVFDHGDSLAMGVAMFLVALAAGALANRFARKEQRRVETVQEARHHVRNALQVVRLHEEVAPNPARARIWTRPSSASNG